MSNNFLNLLIKEYLPMSYFYKIRYPINTMKAYEEKGWALQASGGGLVLGKSHEEGGYLLLD
jgi:hypothetical protein